MKFGWSFEFVRRKRSLLALVTLGACALGALHVWWLPRIVVDDAFISYRYARNFVNGNGLVFNVGERVEGFSNFAWVMLTALGMKVGLDPVGWTRAMGAVAYLGIVALGTRLAFRLSRSIWVAAGTAILLSGSTALCGSAVSGLETGLYGLFVVAALNAMAYGRTRLASVLLGLAAWTRPEGMGLCALAVVLTAWHPRVTRRRWSEVAMIATPALLLVGALLVLRLTYYGHFMPNSVQAKSAMLPLLGSSGWGERFALVFNASGWGYLFDFVRYTFGLALLFAFLPVFTAVRRLWGRARREVFPDAGAMRGATDHAIIESRVMILAAAFTVMGFAVSVYNFGDWMSSYRLLTPYLAPITVLFVMGLRRSLLRLRLLAGRSTFAPACGVAALIVIYCAAGQFQWTRPKAGGSPDLEIAFMLSESKEASLLASTDVLGRLGYYAPETKILDMAGLTDAHIARHGTPKPPFGRSDFGYVLSRRPQFIMNNVRTAWRRHLDKADFVNRYWWVDRAAWTWPGAARGKPRYVFVLRDSILEEEIERRFPDAVFRSPRELKWDEADRSIALNRRR